MWTAALLALALQGVDSTARDSAAVRRVAATTFGVDSATVAAAQLQFKADTAWVRLPMRRDAVSWSALRIERRNGEWATVQHITGIR